jgi:tryptophanyl-tRNA synthetase
MLERNPTLRAEMEATVNPDDSATKGRSVPVAFYIYPVMQVANILLPGAQLVPVGEDQLPRVELARKTARRFNRDFKPIFPEPEALVGRVPRLARTDGNAKMSKSRGNTKPSIGSHAADHRFHASMLGAHIMAIAIDVARAALPPEAG